MPDMKSLLEDVKDYIGITWQDENTDKKVTGYINRGMARLQFIAGAPLDFEKEDLPRSLLLDYCRYANSQALEVFEANFQSELLELNLSYQASVIEPLTVMATLEPSGGYSIIVVPGLSEGNRYVCQVGATLTLPTRLEICIPGNKYVRWNGENIVAAAGQDIMIVEINDEFRAECAGKVTV